MWRKTGKAQVFLIVLIGSLAGQLEPARADVTVEARLDRNVVAVGERITLSVVVMGSGRAGNPELPDLPDFEVLPAGTSRNFSFVNGRMSSSTTYTYILAPRKEGAFTIPPIAVVEGNSRYTSQPLEVRVEAAGAQGSSAQPPQGLGPPPVGRPQQAPRSSVPGRRGGSDARAVFVTADIEPKTGYIGEQLNLTVRFFQGVQLLDRPDYRPPALTGFWVEQLPGERTYYTDVGGRQYFVTELKSAVFPTEAGELVIGPAQVECVIPGRVSDDPFASFFRPFGTGERRIVKSDPLTATVRPIPREGRPADWSGAVGRFRIESRLDPAQVRAGEAATLTVTLSGQGNIRTVGDPQIRDVAGLRSFDSGTTVDDRREGGIVGGVKKISRVFVPEASGSYVIPAISYSVFRPDLDRFETIRTNPITLAVAEGGGGAAPFASPGGTSGQLLAAAGSNLRFIRTGDPALRARNSPPWASPAFWLLQLVPLAGLAAVELVARHRQRVEVDQGYARHRRSRGEARRRLKAARAQLTQGDPRVFYGAVAQALLGYVSDRANLPAGSLTPAEARAELANRQIDDRVVEAFTACLERCDYGRFAPSGSDGARREVMAEAERLLETLPRSGL